MDLNNSSSAESSSKPKPDSIFLDSSKEPSKGKESVIHNYCLEPCRKRSECVFLCQKQGRHVFAKDICFTDSENPVIDLKSEHQLWSRLSFYGVVGVRHIKIRFLSGVKTESGFQVVFMNLERSKSRELEGLHAGAQQYNSEIKEAHSCGVTIEGYRHGNDLQGCHNQFWDDVREEMVCPAQESRDIIMQAEMISWTPALLDYFWQHRAERDGIKFLRSQQFVCQYKDLAYNTYCDAEESYGKAINAIELVRGWRLQRLLWTTLAALICNICIVAVATVASHSIDTGLAAGGYAAAFEAIPFTLLTMLSALIA